MPRFSLATSEDETQLAFGQFGTLLNPALWLANLQTRFATLRHPASFSRPHPKKSSSSRTSRMKPSLRSKK